MACVMLQVEGDEELTARSHPRLHCGALIHGREERCDPKVVVYIDSSWSERA